MGSPGPPWKCVISPGTKVPGVFADCTNEAESHRETRKLGLHVLRGRNITRPRAADNAVNHGAHDGHGGFVAFVFSVSRCLCGETVTRSYAVNNAISHGGHGDLSAFVFSVCSVVSVVRTSLDYARRITWSATEAMDTQPLCLGASVVGSPLYWMGCGFWAISSEKRLSSRSEANSESVYTFLMSL